METNNQVPYYTKYLKTKFFKDLSIVAGGTTTAQLITMAFSPIITRLYGPDAFGILGVFNAAVAVIVPIASFAYSTAIVLPASDVDAKAIVKLSFLITAAVFLASILIIFPFHNQIAQVMGFDAAAVYLLLIPLVVVIASSEQIFREWLTRKKQFKSISGIAIIQAVITGTLKSVVGFFYSFAAVLIILNALSHLLHSFLLWLRAAPSLTISGRWRVADTSGQIRLLTKVAKTYCDFPIYRSPQYLINSISQNLPTLILAALVGPVPTGFYVLSRRVLAMPGTLISNSVGTVFLPRIAEAANRGEMLQPYIIKTTAGLALIGLLPFGIVIIYGPWLFGFVFGDEWVIAGEYARWLSIFIYFMFVNVPSVKAIPILGLQRAYLFYEVLSIVTKVLALLVGVYYFDNDIVIIAIYSVVGAIYYIGLIVGVILLSGKCLRDSMKKPL